MGFFIKDLPERKRIRLQNYDYAQSGYYFVTICIQNRIEWLGEIKKGGMILNEIGKIANECWLNIPKHFPDVILDEFIIMPNHIHGIVVIENNVGNKNRDNVGNKNFCSLQSNAWQTRLSCSLSSIIRGFKIGVTKWCRQNNYDYFQWQKSFYDHIIRNEKSLHNIQKYIKNNPAKWHYDHNNHIEDEIDFYRENCSSQNLLILDNTY